MNAISMKHAVLCLVFVFFTSGFPMGVPTAPGEEADLLKIELGKALFFDPNLSVNRTQSCASCHEPAVGFTGPTSEINALGAVEPGAVPERFGNRKPPSAAYAGDSPVLHYDEAYSGGIGSWIGGMFWDGRAMGGMLGDPLAEQAMGPFVNPLEMAMPGARQVCIRVAHSQYASLFEAVWGVGSLDFAKDPSGMYQKIARSIAAYEKSPEINPFTSKFDLFWDNAAAAGKDIKHITAAGIPGGMMGGGMGGGSMGRCEGESAEDNPACWQHYTGLGLTELELKGLAVFNDPKRGNCASCHSLSPGSAGYPLFTDFSYHNLGIPKNPENPFYSIPRKWNPDGADWVDPGLGGFLRKAEYTPEVYEPEMGKFKTPSLRGVAKLSCEAEPANPECIVKAYGHNGFFKSLDTLQGIIHFYAWRAMKDAGMVPPPMLDFFPPPELDENRITMQPFNFMMGDGARLVALMKTLSDGHFERP